MGGGLFFLKEKGVFLAKGPLKGGHFAPLYKKKNKWALFFSSRGVCFIFLSPVFKKLRGKFFWRSFWFLKITGPSPGEILEDWGKKLRIKKNPAWESFEKKKKFFWVFNRLLGPPEKKVFFVFFGKQTLFKFLSIFSWSKSSPPLASF